MQYRSTDALRSSRPPSCCWAAAASASAQREPTSAIDIVLGTLKPLERFQINQESFLKKSMTKNFGDLDRRFSLISPFSLTWPSLAFELNDCLNHLQALRPCRPSQRVFGRVRGLQTLPRVPSKCLCSQGIDRGKSQIFDFATRCIVFFVILAYLTLTVRLHVASHDGECAHSTSKKSEGTFRYTFALFDFFRAVITAKIKNVVTVDASSL